MKLFGKKKHSSKNLQYETCEVMATEPKFEGSTYTFRFFARASSPKEKYTAGISKRSCPGKQPLHEDRETQLVLNELKVQLVSEGWELLPDKGVNWYSIRFQRVYQAGLSK